MCLNGSKVKGQGHQGQKRAVHSHHPPPAATEWFVVAANNVTQQQTEPFPRCRGWFRRRACGLFGKTSLALVSAGSTVFSLLLLIPPGVTLCDVSLFYLLINVCLTLCCMFITGGSELWQVLFLALSVTFVFVCVWNISGTAERICAQFTRNTCLVPRSDEFEDQGQMSKVKVTRDKKRHFMPFRRPACVWMFCKTSLACSF